MRIREYRGPLGVLAAGVIGVSLLCSVSAMAMSDLRNYIPATLIPPLNIVDFAVSNLNTAVALTQQSVTEFVPTSTVTDLPTSTATATITLTASSTPRTYVTVTPRKTRRPRETNPVTAPILPRRTSTSAPAPVNTAIPPTPVPPTPVPPTPVPPTPVPPTPVPPTSVPPTPVPPTPVPPTPVPPTPVPPTEQPTEQPTTEPPQPTAGLPIDNPVPTGGSSPP